MTHTRLTSHGVQFGEQGTRMRSAIRRASTTELQCPRAPHCAPVCRGCPSPPSVCQPVSQPLFSLAPIFPVLSRTNSVLLLLLPPLCFSSRCSGAHCGFAVLGNFNGKRKVAAAASRWKATKTERRRGIRETKSSFLASKYRVLLQNDWEFGNARNFQFSLFSFYGWNLSK